MDEASVTREATRWRAPVKISAEELRTLVAASGVALGRDKHRLLHSSDWKRWGSRGGRETLRRYGVCWFALLARRRWGRLTVEELEAERVSR